MSLPFCTQFLQFLWTPYNGVAPFIIGEISAISHAVVPLICFVTVEFHQVHQVIQQFRSPNHFGDSLNLDELHKEDTTRRT